MNIIGDSGALQEAMQRRSSQGGSVMSQQSPTSAGYDASLATPPAPTNPAVAPMAPQSMPQPVGMGGMSGAGVPVSPTQTMGNDEAQLIVKTLAKRLDGITPKV